MERLIGIAVSPGVAWGPAALLLQHPLAVRYTVASGHVPREIARLNRAREVSSHQLAEIKARVAATAGLDLAQLFEAQLLMLDDRLLVPRAREIVAEEHANAEWALQRAFDDLCVVLAGAGDEYLRERRGDIADVVGRLRRNLYTAAGRGQDILADIDDGSVLVADDLPPSLAGQLDRRRVIALATDIGSRTHHSAILARSLGLPAVAGLARATMMVRPGTIVLVDGTRGELVIAPTEEYLATMRARRDAEPARPVLVPAPPAEPTLTADGVAVRLDANIELPSEIDAARAVGAQGIGLFRSEFMLRGQAVSALEEEDQYRVYRTLAERMSPLPVTVRTFDLDAGPPAGPEFAGAGPSPPGASDVARGPLGMRAIRLSLSDRPAFRKQLRAIARAARHGNVRVLLPFVTSVDELRQARVELARVRAELREIDGLDPDIPMGAMIEIPSAALTVDLLAAEADFFSIGTNDLVQYCLAVDRTDGRMAALYDPLHPAVLRIIRLVVRSAGQRHRPVAVCGEIAAEAGPLALLLGLGVTAFSMNPGSIPAARRAIRATSVREARRMARQALRIDTGGAIAGLLARTVIE